MCLLLICWVSKRGTHAETFIKMSFESLFDALVEKDWIKPFAQALDGVFDQWWDFLALDKQLLLWCYIGFHPHQTSWLGLNTILALVTVSFRTLMAQLACRWVSVVVVIHSLIPYLLEDWSICLSPLMRLLRWCSSSLQIELNWWKGKPSGSIACTRKQQPRFYWSRSSVVMNGDHW